MPIRNSGIGIRKALPLLLLVISLACSLPVISQPTASPSVPTATLLPRPVGTPQPLPPALVESDPLPGVELPGNKPITLYFSQPMNRASVQSAASISVNGQPAAAGSFNWINDSTLTFTPQQPWKPGATLAVNVSPRAQSVRGLALSQPVSLTYQTAGYLRLAQSLPAVGSKEVDPSSAVVAAFNRPVVPLGAAPGSLPPGFSLSSEGQPVTQGNGSWLNTSTYIFNPQPALEGGKTYTVHVNPDLKAADGAGLDPNPSPDNPYEWSFSTALPRLVSMEPAQGSQSVRLDAKIVLNFNQPMDPASVEANFRLVGPGAAQVEGKIGWDEANTTLTFTPGKLLERNTAYNVILLGQAQARGGTPLGSPLNAILKTVSPLGVISSEPLPGGVLNPYASIVLHFTAPIPENGILSSVAITPTVANLNPYWDDQDLSLRLNGDFAPSTAYTLTLASSLMDAWNGPLSQPYSLSFRTAPLEPGLVLVGGSDVFFITPQEANLPVQVTNLANVPLTIGSVPLTDFFSLLGPKGYDLKQTYQPSGQQSLDQALNQSPDRSQSVNLSLTSAQRPLVPGLYFLRFNLPGQSPNNGPFLVVASNIQLTFKISATDALVWAVDLRSHMPLPNAPITLYAEDGRAVASGQTGADGVFRASFPARTDPYSNTYAVLSQPGQDDFSLAMSAWDQGMASWDFGIATDFSGPHLDAYLYTDRPIYRPGQTIYFRAVARQAYNGRYSLPDQKSLPLSITGSLGEEITSLDLPLSAFGTGHGQYTLPADAAPGYYSLGSKATSYASVSFQVADYRKPEINLQVGFNQEQVQAGQVMTAPLSARYFFDAPAGNIPIHWDLYANPSAFTLPDYQVGLQDTRWLQAYDLPFPVGNPLGKLIAQGDARTNPDGTLVLGLPTQADASRRIYTLEVTAKDEAGLPVSTRAAFEANPAEYYIGVRPETWVGQSGQPSGFQVQTVDWQQKPSGPHPLRAEFQKVSWVRSETGGTSAQSGRPLDGPTLIPQYTLVASTDFSTDEQGRARLAFTPDQPGTYQINVIGKGDSAAGTARTELLLWVGGPGQAVWPALPNQRLQLTANKESYQPGETAQVFIPNPYPTAVPALVTLERGIVISYQVITLDPGGSSLSFPLNEEHSPNIYVSVTLLGRDATNRPDFRQGYLDLAVKPAAQTLTVSLTSQPKRLAPGGNVTFDLLATDSSGKPAQAEFSLAVVDLAALALAGPNSPGIVPAFYDLQPLGVRTGLDLAAYARRQAALPPGAGGGGNVGAAPPQVVRERFPDTAFWNAEIVTGADGKAQVSVPLPDNLTTWQVDLRGLTVDSRTGEATTQIVTSKDLLVRPVTPRFLVAGDHTLLAAVVQNNTTQDIPVEVSLQGSGFQPDDPGKAVQTVKVQTNGRARVEWWGTVQDAASADLIFTARSGPQSGSQAALEDSARPDSGPLPIYHFNTQQSFVTSGVLAEGGQRLEQVSLPQSFQPSGGDLKIELAPSLAAALLRSLDTLDELPYECTEQSASRLLPTLEVYRAIQQFGLKAPELQDRLNRALNPALQSLLARQNADGGWGSCQGDDSNLYISAYALLGLAHAKQAGLSVSPEAAQRAVDFIKGGLGSANLPKETWQLDRLAFEQYVLVQAGAGDAGGIANLYSLRDQLDPWAQALLAASLEGQAQDSQPAKTLLSNLESSAVRSAASAHWELHASAPDQIFGNRVTSLANSAIVVYVLAQYDPGSALLGDAVRFLISNRQADGGWSSTYATAWTVMALTEIIKGTGELGGSFGFGAALNGAPVASGQAGGAGQINPVTADIPIENLYTDMPNALLIQRDPGPGRLYYSAALNVNRPVESIPALQNGLSIGRAYYPSGSECPGENCPAIQSAQAGQRITVRLSLTLEHDAYDLVVQDFIPAGAEILDTHLLTSQQGPGGAPVVEPQFDPRHPFDQGWGWWYFHEPQIHADRIAWEADTLPAGTYQLTYTLVILQPGQYRVLPARAGQIYFPDVQGSSAGVLFEIKP